MVVRNWRAFGSAMSERIARAPSAPSPSHPFGMGPSLSRKAGEGLSAIAVMCEPESACAGVTTGAFQLDWIRL